MYFLLVGSSTSVSVLSISIISSKTSLLKLERTCILHPWNKSARFGMIRLFQLSLPSQMRPRCLFYTLYMLFTRRCKYTNNTTLFITLLTEFFALILIDYYSAKRPLGLITKASATWACVTLSTVSSPGPTRRA